MSKSKAEKHFDHYYRRFNAFQYYVRFPLFKLRAGKEARCISDNESFRNIHKGQRCFILGNGPSIKQQDLSKLEHEIVFSVNQISRHPQFEKIKPTYHFWSDPGFFNLSEDKPEDMELLRTMVDVNTSDNHPTCFYPYEYKWFVKKYKLDEKIDIHYYKQAAIHMIDEYDLPMDFARYIPSFGTVVQYCIAMAIYMGFDDIYLLGCDSTGIVHQINLLLNDSTVNSYAYEVSENEKKRLQNVIVNHPIEEWAGNFYFLLQNYRYLYEYCRGRNIRLWNASSSTVITSIPRVCYEDLF